MNIVPIVDGLVALDKNGLPVGEIYIVATNGIHQVHAKNEGISFKEGYKICRDFLSDKSKIFSGCKVTDKAMQRIFERLVFRLIRTMDNTLIFYKF
jgi:hypothetical protein